MAKGKNNTMPSYIKGTAQIKSFIKSEIGTEKAAKAKFEKLKETATAEKGSITNAEMEQLKKLSKVKHHEFFKTYEEYGNKVQKFLNKYGKTFTEKDMADMMAVNRDIRTSGSPFNDKEFLNAEPRMKAVAKYTMMLLENDGRRFGYYKFCLENNKELFWRENMLEVETPARFKAPETDIVKYAKYFKALEEKLNKTEGFHVNSAEYNRMKKAIRAINNGFEKGIDYHPLGECFEELQAASMDYINAKGVGTQSSQRGIDRMDAALDICRLSSGGMGYFMSKDRSDKIKAFEKETFKMYFEYKIELLKIGPVNEVYKTNEVNKAKEEIEESREL